MSTVIGVTARDLLLPVVEPDMPAAVVLGAPGEEPLEQALATAWSALETVGHLVVVVPAGLAEAHRVRLGSVRSLLESHRMALVEVDLPPLALALLVRQLRRISRYDLGPGVVASAAALLTHYLYAGAVLGSIARLERVAGLAGVDVGLGTHLKSYLPGARFAVLAAPGKRLVPLTEETRLPGPDYPTQLVHATGELTDEWVTGRLGPQWKCGQTRQVPLPEASVRWWGTARLVEFAAHIDDVGVLYRLVSSAHRRACPWCGLDLVGDRCAFCTTRIAAEAGPRESAANQRAG